MKIRNSGHKVSTLGFDTPRFSARWVEETDKMRQYTELYQEARSALQGLSIDQLTVLEDAARETRLLRQQGRERWQVIPFVTPAHMLDNLGNSFVSAVHQFARRLPQGMRFPFAFLFSEYVEQEGDR